MVGTASGKELRPRPFGTFDGATSSYGVTFAMFAQHRPPGFLTGYRNRFGAILRWWFAFTRDLRRERTFNMDYLPVAVGACGGGNSTVGYCIRDAN
jgi:hypothetical protein